MGYLRESSMPPQEQWEALLDVENILDRFALTGDIAELGCGYGTFTLPLARRTSGRVHAFDIDAAMIRVVRERAAAAGMANIDVQLRDVAATGYGLAQSSCDACLLFNILHAESPIALIRESARVLRPGGTLAVIHWRSDIETPRGPSSAIRPTAAMVTRWAAEAGGLAVSGEPFLLLPWHYGLRLTRMKER